MTEERNKVFQQIGDKGGEMRGVGGESIAHNTSYYTHTHTHKDKPFSAHIQPLTDVPSLTMHK